MTDREVVDKFICFLRSSGFSNVKIERRPDEENRSTQDIDAIATPFAIEHTSVDSLPDQRRHDDWYKRVIDGLEQKHRATIGARLVLSMGWGELRTGQDWSAIREAIDRWITDEFPAMPDGPRVLSGIPGIPFDLHAIKRSDWRPALVFYRFDPNDQTFAVRLQQSVQRKSTKLRPYSDRFRTVLLIESNDVALMSPLTMQDSISAVAAGSGGEYADEIWFADTTIPEDCRFWKMYDSHFITGRSS